MSPISLVCRWIAIAIVCHRLALPTANAAELRLLPGSAHDLKVTELEAGWQLETTGTDPYIVHELQQPLAAEDRVLEFEYVCAVPIKDLRIYHGPPISAERHFELPSLAQAEGWHRYTADLSVHLGHDLPPTTRMLRIDWGSEVGVTLRIRRLQLRPLNPDEIEAKAGAAVRELAKQQSSERIVRYLAGSLPNRIDTVRVGADRIEVVANWNGQAPPQLVEFPVERSIGDDRGGLPIPYTIDVSGARARFVFPRRVNHRDRLHSGFALVDPDDPKRLLSPRTFATGFDAPVVPVSAPPKPRNQKGLSGLSRRGPEADLAELGISAVTMNLVLNRFISDSEGRGQERIPVDGASVYFNHEAFPAIDELVALARKYDLVVSAILLITNHDAVEPASALIHPEVNGGVYAMPDLTTSRGAGVYAFVLDKLANRYRDPISEQGGITNWIAHNEIDFHSVWTNFGKQPRAVATETYYRSMRMIHNAARVYQPQARVFASLTHHWTVPDDGSGDRLAPREVVETLQRLSELEGDFAWGIAYHPYPESLFANSAWQDKTPTDGFDTPLITIQNLPVLGRFLEQASMRNTHGDLRPVLLSEQGFHTADTSDEAQRYQALSLQYAMKQVQRMPIVESFHYHRWLDHPDEGGLNLGLRTAPTPSHPYGVKKMAWEVYRDQ